MKVTETASAGRAGAGAARASPTRAARSSSRFAPTRTRAMGIDATFRAGQRVVSRRGVLRGLHFQHPHGQAKLIQAVRGEVFDVAVDVRVGSPTFGHAVWTTLSESNHRQLFIPAGFAHGFVVMSDEAVVAYKCSDVLRAGVRARSSVERSGARHSVAGARIRLCRRRTKRRRCSPRSARRASALRP